MVLPGKPDDPRRPSSARIAVLVVVGAIGLYLVVSGLIGLLNPS